MLSKIEGDKDLSGWLARLQGCMLILNMRGAERRSPLDRFLHSSGRSGRGWEGCGFDYTNLSYITKTSFLPDAVVPKPGMQLQVQEAGTIPKQETVTIPLNLYVRIPKGLIGRIVPSLQMVKLGLRVKAAVLQQSGQPTGSVPV